VTEDHISLRGLEVYAHHGVYEEEQSAGQKFLVDVDVWMDLSVAGASDDLDATLHYGELGMAIHSRVSSERWDLIERVAERVAEVVLADDRVERTLVTIHKPSAPIPLEFRDVSVTIMRSR
jgi:dihydroneopterin aldolase